MLEHLGEDVFAGTWPGFLAQGWPAFTQRRPCYSALSLLSSAGASASPLKILCTPEGIRLQCFMKYFTEEMKVNWYHK